MPIAQMPLQAPITQQPITQQPITQQAFTYFATSASPITQQPITQQPITQQALPAALGGLALRDILASGRSVPACAAGGRLGAVSKLGTITIASLRNAAPIVQAGATGTLADAYCAGMLTAGATLQDLANQGDLRGFTLGDIAWYGDLKVIDLLVALGADVERFTFGDLVGMMINRLSIDWEGLSPETLAEAGANAAGKTTLTAGFTLVGAAGGSAPAIVTVTLPPFARYIGGSVKLDGVAFAPLPVVTSIVTGEAKRARLAWTVPNASFNTPHQLALDIYAGFVLGPQTADLRVATVADTLSNTARRPLTVVDTFGDAGAGNNTPATAAILPATSGLTTPGGEVIESYIASAGDIDVFKVPSPVAGYRLSVHLTNLPADYDVSIVGPDQPALRPGAGAPLQDPTIRDNGVDPENRNASLEPAAVQDLPITQQPITQQSLDQSLNRGLTDEDAATLTRAGDYFIRVAGYNGAFSPKPYSLRVELTPVSPEPICTPRALTGGGIGTAPTGLPAGTNTIFVVNRQRLAQTYSEADATSIISALTTISNGPAALGVKGVVLPVDSYQDVRTAYATWDANPCSATRSNAVSSAIGAKIDAIRGSSADGQVRRPRRRLRSDSAFAVPDVTRIANETGNAATFANNQYFGWAASAKVLTDDPYYTTAPVSVSGGSQVFIPDLVGGRLVETPAQITAQLTQYATANGTLLRQTAFASGYDFVKDGATQPTRHSAVSRRSRCARR